MRLLLPVVAILSVAVCPAVADVRPATRTERHPEEGRPVIRNYSPEDYGGGGQNWAIVQDGRGLLYVGSTGGVLEHDGLSWRLIPVPNRDTIRSLAIDDEGRIFAGGVGELGYLAPDEAGQLQFVSLKDRIPEEARTFGDVWRTHVLPDGVYFQSAEALFRWSDGKMRVWKPAVRFNRASAVDGRLYLTQPAVGLTVLEDGAFRSLPGTEQLANEVFPAVLPHEHGRLLIGTRANGFFIHDGASLVPFPTEIDPVLKASGLYRGLVLPDGTFALSTLDAGLVVMDPRGRQVQVIDKRLGLANDIVYYAMADRDGALWMGSLGLSRVETPSPASYFLTADMLQSAVSDILRHRGRLYVAGQEGVSVLRPATQGRLPEFVRVAGIRNQCWWFAGLDDPSDTPPQLLLGCSDGLFRIEGEMASPVRPSVGGDFLASVLLRSRVDPARVWVGLFNGLVSIRWADGRWVDEGRVAGISDQVRTLHENPDGSLWAGTQATGLLRVSLEPGAGPGAPRGAARVERFGAADGLIDGGVFVVQAGGTAYFQVGGAHPFVARRDEASKTFVPEPAFDDVRVDQLTGGFGLYEGPDGTVHANFGRETVAMRRAPDGTWTVDRARFSRFGDRGAARMYVEADGTAWLALEDRLARFDPARQTGRERTLTTMIRRVTANQTRLLFGGASEAVDPPRLDPALSALRFEFAAPRFGDQNAIEYQSRLEGLDPDWSPWTHESRRDFTNLGFGDYHFRVRARHAGGQVSDEAVYAFTILPPWYRTWWAYAAYVLLIAALAFSVDRLQRRRVIGKERARAQFAEAGLRAESAEALARSESEGKKRVELLSNIGREITASLDFERIFHSLYDRVNELADAGIFGVGLYHPERQQIEYRFAIENGKRYEPYTRDASDPNQLPVWCLEHREPVFINDVAVEASRYISAYNHDHERGVLEDGTLSQAPQSLIYLPLVSNDRVLGVITIQSLRTRAYTEQHLSLMQSLASYTAIALDNASAYERLNENEHEIRRLFEEAQRARAAAEEADAAKSAFLSTVSHELRTPLTSVLGFAKIIQKRLEDRLFPLIQTDEPRTRQTMQQVQENLRVVVSEGERLTKLIDDVLDLAKIEAGKLEWHMEPVTIAEIVEHATNATASLFDRKDLALVRRVDPDLPPLVGDRDRLIQVVINLLSNAVKFTESGSVTCRAERRDGSVVVSVVDTGMGIAPDDQPKVFERFKQVGDTLTDKPKGTGLGLPICREIVEHHGGRIWVESEPGRGSTFSFSVPIAAAEGAEKPFEAPIDLAALIRQLRDRVDVATPRPVERAPRILVVDDDPNIRELLSQELGETGYRVQLAPNGREALAAIRRERPDLVVLDVMMPEMNGFDVAAVLKNDPATADIPILILSIVQDRDRGYRLGVDRYLTKPIDTDLLFREIGALLEQGKSRKRVLVVDEDASTVRTLSEVLQSRGYSVSEASGHDLRERALALQPDVIMLSSAESARSDAVRMLRFERGLENVLFLVYQDRLPEGAGP